jgi:hypothetical protein
MVSTIDLVGYILAGVMVLAIVVLAVISWVKGRRRGRRGGNEDGGGTGIMSEGSTPGDWGGTSGGDS